MIRTIYMARGSLISEDHYLFSGGRMRRVKDEDGGHHFEFRVGARVWGGMQRNLVEQVFGLSLESGGEQVKINMEIEPIMAARRPERGRR